jgi:hypothetical protein
VSIDQTWLDRNAAWWAKLDRAEVHLRSRRDQIEQYRAANPYEVAPEPTDTPDRVAYRVHVRRQVPVAINTIIGDIVHILRPALDSLADEMAVRHVGRPLKDAEPESVGVPDACDTGSARQVLHY